MKQQDRNNGYPVGRLSGYPDIRQTAEQEGYADEALYQQILAELRPGAEEYDKIVAEGRHPAARKHRIIPYYKYAAVACVLLAVAGGGIWFLQAKTEDDAQTPLVAHTGTMKQGLTEVVSRVQTEEILQSEEGLQSEKTPVPSLKHPQDYQSRSRKSRPLPVTPSAPPEEDSFETSAEAPDQELYLALLAEVEARETQIEQLKQQSMRALFDELIYNIEQQPNRPELSL